LRGARPQRKDSHHRDHRGHGGRRKTIDGRRMTDARIHARSSLVVGPLRLRAQADCKLEGKKVRRSTNAITAHICASFALSPSNFLTFTSDPILRRAILRPRAPKAIPQSRAVSNGNPVSITGRGLARLWSAVACYRFRRRGLPRRPVFLACCRAFGLRPVGRFAACLALRLVSRSGMFHPAFAGSALNR
jgi:hypothetical protein